MRTPRRSAAQALARGDFVSDLVVKQPACKHAHSNRCDSSAPLFARRGAAPSFPLSLTRVRERSADWRYVLVLAPRRRCRVPLRGTPPPGAPLWRLPPRDRLVRSGPETFISVIRAAFAALHPDRTGLLAKAALRRKGEREPEATRTAVRVHRSAGATPAPPFRRLMMAPSHEQACGQYRVLRTAQD